MDAPTPPPGGRLSTVHGRCVSIGGLPFQVTASPSTAWTVDEMFEVADDHARPARFTLDVSDEPATAPESAPLEQHHSLRIWRTPDGLVVDSGQDVIAVANQNGITVRGAESGHRFAVGLRRCLHYAISHVLTVNGRTVLHAAVVARNGRGVLLLGGREAGKSTTTFIASSAGWGVVSDDLVAAWVDNGDVWVTGVPRALAVPTDALESTDVGDKGDALAHDPRDRRRLTISLVHEPVVISAVALVSHGIGDGEIAAATQTELFRLVFTSSPDITHPRSAAEAFQLTQGLLAHPLWHLRTPDTAAGRRAQLPGLLARLQDQVS